jgi:uncharacterized membrane protein YhaH (DUF805 family)
LQYLAEVWSKTLAFVLQGQEICLPQASVRGLSIQRRSTLPIAKAAQINWPHLLLSTRGRITRTEWWIGCVFLLIIDGIAAALNRLSGISLAVVLALVFLLILYCALAVTVKRLHDRDRRGWWILMFPLGFVVLVSVLSTFGEDLDPMLYYTLLALTLIIAAAAVMELGLRQGTTAINRYGADPLAKVRSEPR